MLLAIDVGNTNTVFALFDGTVLQGQWRMSTSAHRTADEYAVWLRDIIRHSDIAIEAITDVIIASVVPSALFSLRSLTSQYFRAEAIIVGDENVPLGIEIHTERPSEVGADRLVNAVAAYRQYGGDLIVIDFGTATTFDVVDTNGNYVGGVISPGIQLSLDALHQAAAKLPNVAVARPDKIIGKSTISAMQSGIFHGYLGLIEGISARIKHEYGKEMTVIATGGLAPLFAQATEIINYLDNDLTIQGLYLIHQLQHSVSASTTLTSYTLEQTS